ncbi:response regulator [Aquimarina sp. M1]
MNQDRLFLLLAKDDPDDSELFSRIINEISQNIAIAVKENGKQLMDYLNDTSNELPDILFLDLNMPAIDGFQCLKEIKNTERLKHFPVVVFTTSNNYMDIEKAHEYGGDFYIQKPNNYKDLFEVFKNQLTHVE